MAFDRSRGKKSRKKVCAFCVEKVDKIDYKDTARLRKFTSDRAKILPRRVRHMCLSSARAHISYQARTSRCTSSVLS